MAKKNRNRQAKRREEQRERREQKRDDKRDDKQDAREDNREETKPAAPPSRPQNKHRAGRRGVPQARTLRDDNVLQPQFWFGFEVSWAKLVTARVVVFGILALDALLQIRHAPRYGAGNFNVANLGFLDDYGPGRIGYGAGQLLVSYFLVLAALGVATRVVLPIATVIYAWLYFGSQLDSYQHHYLVSLVLALSCFVPWQRPEHAMPSTPVRSWALRLILVQLAIMYLWAAISKIDPAWLDGTTLGSQITGSMKSMITSTVGFKAASIIVIVVELTLALCVWWPRTWTFAAPLGVLFHIGIVATGFEIGLFAYVMVALYILIVPDRVWMKLGHMLAPLGEELRKLATRPGWITIGAALVVGVLCSLVVRLPNALAVVFGLGIVPILVGFRAITRGGPPIAAPAIAHVVAILLWLAVDRTTSVAEDYYRYWGGSQRRIGDKTQSEEAYRKLLEIVPDDVSGHYQLGRLLLARDRFDDGLAELHTAQRLDPKQVRSFIEEARWLAGRGRQADAIAKAAEAVAADPSDTTARQLLDNLRNNRATPVVPDRDP